MAGGDIQKLKLFYLYDILKEKTDEDHAIAGDVQIRFKYFRWTEKKEQEL